MKKVVAHSAKVNLQTGDFHIDGVRLPWWLAAVDPEINHDGGTIELSVSFLIDGPVTIVSESGGWNTYDRVIGETGAWARRYVRDQLSERFGWLDL